MVTYQPIITDHIGQSTQWKLKSILIETAMADYKSKQKERTRY